MFLHQKKIAVYLIVLIISESSKCQVDQGCGTISYNLEPLIVNGEVEKYGESPWHVAIYKKYSNGKIYLICGGTIISAYMILSAAHCFYDLENSKLYNKTMFEVVVAKRYRNYSINESIYQRNYEIEEIRVPTEYYDRTTNFGYDIALICLKTEIQFSSVVLPACIDLDQMDYEISEGTLGKLSGWGLANKDNPPEVLLTANLTFYNYKTCISFFAEEDRSSVTQDKICGGNETGPGARRGDSGGGFVFLYPHTGKYYLRGIVSARIVTQVSTSLFTDITRYKKWIKTNAAELESRIFRNEQPCSLPNGIYYVNLTNKCKKVSYDMKIVSNSCEIIIQCDTDSPQSQSICTNGTWMPQLPLSCISLDKENISQTRSFVNLGKFSIITLISLCVLVTMIFFYICQLYRTRNRRKKNTPFNLRKKKRRNLVGGTIKEMEIINRHYIRPSIGIWTQSMEEIDRPVKKHDIIRRQSSLNIPLKCND